jgi:molybdate transport system substrate-binding protein
MTDEVRSDMIADELFAGRILSEPMRSRFASGLLLGCALTFGLAARPQLVAAELKIAVASNFATTMQEVSDLFEARTGHEILLSSGSTGKHYAQIRNGAPYDLLFAADRQRPALLEEAKIAVPGSRFTYAIGRLVLWSTIPGLVDPEGAILAEGNFRHLAIANPRLAPYGSAAREALRRLGLWHEVSAKLVQGENIAQALAFVESGNAELGFVGFAQIRGAGLDRSGSIWMVPAELHAPIEQQAVLLRESEAAKSFLALVRGADGRRLIEHSGYEVPEP